jgi:hypothetical protein
MSSNRYLWAVVLTVYASSHGSNVGIVVDMELKKNQDCVTPGDMFFHTKFHNKWLIGVFSYYVGMYVWGEGHNPAPVPRPTMISCASPLINPLLILHFEEMQDFFVGAS